MNILLHICCAPCSIFPIEAVRAEGHKITGFFYNPNIHPYSEYLKRKNEVEKYSQEAGLDVIFSDYDMEKFFQHTVYNEAPKTRCAVCWWLRLDKTARWSAQNGFDAFTTTLLVSPYQDHEKIKTIGDQLTKNIKIEAKAMIIKPAVSISFSPKYLSAR